MGASLTYRSVAASFRGQEKFESKFLCRWHNWQGLSSPDPSPALLARHTVALGPAVLAEIGSLQNFPSPQCAAGALRQVEDEHVSAFQGGPCHLRGELIGSYSIYIKSVMSSCFLSLGEEMDLTA